LLEIVRSSKIRTALPLLSGEAARDGLQPKSVSSSVRKRAQALWLDADSFK